MEMGSFVQRAFDRSEGSGMKDISRICGPRDWEWWIVWFITFRGKESIRIFARRSSHRFIQHHRHGLAFFFFFLVFVPGSRTLDWVGPLHREVDRPKARRMSTGWVCIKNHGL